MKKKKFYPYIILSIFAILVLVIAYQIRPDNVNLAKNGTQDAVQISQSIETQESFGYTVCLNVGFIILTIVVVNGLWFLLGGDPLETMMQRSVDKFQLASDAFETGLCRAFSCSSKFATADEWIGLLKKARKKVDMMGYSLQTWTRTTAFQTTLADLANKGVEIRILIMDENNPSLSAGLNTVQISSLTTASMEKEIDACTKCIRMAENKIRQDKKENLKFTKIKQGLTECQIIRIDGQIFVTPYLYSQHTSDSPLFISREQDGGYFEKYMDEINSLWDLNQPNQPNTTP